MLVNKQKPFQNKLNFGYIMNKFTRYTLPLVLALAALAQAADTDTLLVETKDAGYPGASQFIKLIKDKAK